MLLLLNNFENFHGASLDTDATSDALGCGILGFQDHDLHGANLYALATADTVLFVDHVHAGLGVLGDGIMLTSFHALAALDTDHGLRAAVFTRNNLDTGIVGVELLVESLGASIYTCQAGHTLNIFLYSELLHN